MGSKGALLTLFTAENNTKATHFMAFMGEPFGKKGCSHHYTKGIHETSREMVCRDCEEQEISWLIGAAAISPFCL